MNKLKLIQEFLSNPIQIGDTIFYYGDGNGSKNKYQKAHGIVTSIDDNILSIKGYYGDRIITRSSSDVVRSVNHIGANNFIPYKRVNGYSINIELLLHQLGVKIDKNIITYKNENVLGHPVNEINFNPFIKDENDNEISYQRDLVWDIKDKQLLIDSIYNNIDIGNFIFRLRSYEWVENRIKNKQIENTAFKDMVDGKQRATTIISFINNEFKDNYDNFWKDLSKDAQRRFLNYSNLNYIEMGESTTDKEVQETFLTMNFSGIPMSKKHLNFVKNIKL